MIRKFNYTGRIKIPRANIAITLTRRTEGPPVFNVQLDLTNLGLPTDASVYIEAYYRDSFMRFDFGAVGAIKVPDNRLLDELPTQDVVHFRVKVVDRTSKHGLILAVADGLTATTSGRSPLLPVNFTPLGNIPWQLNFENDKPTLEVNNEGLGDSIREIVRTDEQFFALVLPAVLRQILTHIVLLKDDVDLDSQDDWETNWIRFAQNLPGMVEWPSAPHDREDERRKRLRWVDDAVESFCNFHKAASKFRNALERRD